MRRSPSGMFTPSQKVVSRLLPWDVIVSVMLSPAVILEVSQQLWWIWQTTVLRKVALQLDTFFTKASIARKDDDKVNRPTSLQLSTFGVFAPSAWAPA